MCHRRDTQRRSDNILEKGCSNYVKNIRYVSDLAPSRGERRGFREILEEVNPVSSFEDWKTYLLKGDRGDREGKYLWMIEFESVEARDRLFPSPGEQSKEVQQFLEAQAAVFEKWATFATPVDIISTDYVVVDK